MPRYTYYCFVPATHKGLTSTVLLVTILGMLPHQHVLGPSYGQMLRRRHRIGASTCGDIRALLLIKHTRTGAVSKEILDSMRY